MMIQLVLLFSLLFHLHQCQKTPPVIIEQPQDIIAELDKPMALHCRAESSSLDDLHIDWYKDGRLVTTDSNARIITEFMALHVINTMPQDAGVYYCLAKNSYGQTQSRKARIQFLKLDKEFPISPISTTASLGERIRLQCQPPNGSPNPIIYWTKDGNNLSIPLDHYDLILPSIEHSDFGSYRCIASNGLIRQSAIAYLTEFQRPNMQIQPSSSRMDLHRGQSIILQCQIDNDQYELEWHYENKIIRNNQINISSIEFNQSGIYTCIANYNNGQRKYKFDKEILLAVHDRLILDKEEKLISQSNQTVFLGRSAVINCQLPFISEYNISWRMMNQTDLENIKFDYLDKNHYRLEIHRIKEVYNNMIFECYYGNKNKLSQGLIQLNVERIKLPPIISLVPNNQTVSNGVDVIFSCQSNEETNVQWWFISNSRVFRRIKINNNRKYQIEKNHALMIRRADKNDAGTYKCILTNNNNDETTWIAHLHVEDIRSPVLSQRTERKDLPAAPSQPSAITLNPNSIELAWNTPSTDILDYLIEYINLNSDNPNLQWEHFLTTNSNTRQIIHNLKPNSVYQFIIRARNSFGYGQPSQISELIETKNEQESTAEKFLHLFHPINIQDTSITLKWNILQKNKISDHLSIYIINKKEIQERIEILTNIHSLTAYTITNLLPNTDYSIRLVSTIEKINHSSNTISVRTLESIPLSCPTNILVQLISTTSLSIRWNPPLENETNGQIIAYKVNCLGSNETNSIRLLNISSDAKGLFIKNLIENTEYCISIAARTRIGYGPYSPPACVTMNDDFLQLNRNGIKYRLRQVISQPWFLPVIIISSILFTVVLCYAIWLCLNYLIQQHHHRIKFASSTSSSNQFVEMPIQKTLSNGTRYDLIKDTSPSTALWMDSIQNGIRLQCCTTTTTTGSASSNNEQEHHSHHSMNIQKNPINTLLQQCRHQQQLNPYASTGIFQQCHSPQQVISSPPPLPTYSESVHLPSSSHHLLSEQQKQQITSSVQYQPPWLDHPSSSLQYRSQSRTSHNHHCIHCTSHPHTPSSIRTTATRSPSFRHQHNSPVIKTATVNNNEIKKTIDNTPITMNSSSLVKRQSHFVPPPQSSNSMMIHSLGGETMTTSWASSTDANNPESVSSPSTELKNAINQQMRLSSGSSIFSDSDIQQDELNPSPLVNFERGPSFLIPNV